jgi:ABC-type long-subunit fatty acid transport system fused permease/ATPase subunit
MDIDLKHLKKIKANYFKHFAYATYYNFLALLVFITGVIHSIFPFVFALTPYKLAKKITDGTERNFIKHSKERDDSKK